MAIIRPLGNKWKAEVRRRNKECDFYQCKTWPTKRQAKEWATKLEAELDLEQQGRINTIKTFGDAVERYMSEVSPRKPSHRWELIRSRQLKNYPLYNVYMNKIEAQHIADYRDTRLNSVSDGTVLRELSFISAIFARAMKEWNWIKFNPIGAISKPKKTQARDRRISDDEIIQILEALKFEEGQPIILKMHQVAALFLLALETAMRLSEMTMLEWNQVNTAQRYIQLNNTKNGDKRQIPLSKRALEILSWLTGLNNKKVFTVTSSVAGTTFRNAKAKTNIKDLHFHDSRREAASRLAKKLDVMDLAKMTGHRDVKMLLNVYYKPVTSEIADLLD